MSLHLRARSRGWRAERGVGDSIEQFSNGITIISLYLNPLPGANAPPIEHSIFQVMKEASLLYCLPDNPFFYASGAASGTHAVQEAVYACASFFILYAHLHQTRY